MGVLVLELGQDRASGGIRVVPAGAKCGLFRGEGNARRDVSVFVGGAKYLPVAVSRDIEKP